MSRPRLEASGVLEPRKGVLKGCSSKRCNRSTVWQWQQLSQDRVLWEARHDNTRSSRCDYPDCRSIAAIAGTPFFGTPIARVQTLYIYVYIYIYIYVYTKHTYTHIYVYIYIYIYIGDSAEPGRDEKTPAHLFAVSRGPQSLKFREFVASASQSATLYNRRTKSG